LLLGIAATQDLDQWALLVSGSEGYWNYRHQSDVFHAW